MSTQIILCQALMRGEGTEPLLTITTTRFYCFIKGKIKRSAKNLELDINVAKRAIPRFSAASSKFCGKRRIPRRGVKIRSRAL